MQKQKGKFFLLSVEKSILIFEAALLVLTAVLVLFGKTYYDNMTTRQTLKENRYITTEWHLMEILKKQTDEQLLELNAEIDRLKAQYNSLSSANVNRPELQELIEKIQSAEKEKEDILNMRSLSTSETYTAPVEVENAEKQEYPTVQKILDENRINTLIEQINEARQSIDDLNRDLLKSKQDNSILEARLQEKEDVIQNYKVFYKDLLLTISTDMRSLIGFLEQSIITNPRAEMDDLVNYELVKAILSLPEIRKDYPDIISGLDRYLLGFGESKSIQGSNDAFTEVLKIVREQEGALEDTLSKLSY